MTGLISIVACSECITRSSVKSNDCHHFAVHRSKSSGINVTYSCSSRLAVSERISIRCLSLFSAYTSRDAAGLFLSFFLFSYLVFFFRID